MRQKIILKDLYGNEKEVDVSELEFRPSVYGILIEDEKILLFKQFGDGYDFPGGGVEIQETTEDALKREFWEETGLKVSIGEVIHCETSLYYSMKGKKWNCLLMYFLCEKIGGEITIENFDELEREYANGAEWIALNKIEKIKFYNSLDSSIGIIQKAINMLK